MAWFYFWRNPNFLLVVGDESPAGTKQQRIFAIWATMRVLPAQSP